MEFARKIRLKHGRYLLRKKAAGLTRKRFGGNLRNAKSIGIAWDATDISSFTYISQFQLKMQERNIETRVIAYYPGKILPDKLTAIRYLMCLRKEDLNYYYIPVSSDSEAFIKTNFDILIEINFNRCFPVGYITELSQAGLKIGLFDEGRASNPYDLMIDAGKPVKVNEFLENVIHYLEIVNSTSG